MSSSTVTKAQITEFLVNMMTKEKQIDPVLLYPNNELKNLGIDSFSFLEIIFTIEHEYNIQFPKEFGDLITLDDVVNLTHTLIQDKENNASAA